MLRFGSLFAGIGGFDLGFEQAGLECAWQVEIDPECKKLLREKFPKAHLEGDINDVKEVTAVDVICGGFPCQDVSLAGPRTGLDGERSGLWFEFHRILRGAKPQWVVVENVPGLFSSNDGRDFGVVIQGLVELGYGVCWRVLDSQYFGLAQRRQRIFIVGSRGNGRSAQVLFEPTNVSGYSQPGREKKSEVTSETGGVAESQINTYALSGFAEYVEVEVLGTLRANSGDSIRGMAGLIQDPRGVRRYMPLEYERLQGFPDNWTAGFSNLTRYKMLGNAVAVPCARWIGERINSQV